MVATVVVGQGQQVADVGRRLVGAQIVRGGVVDRLQGRRIEQIVRKMQK